MTASLPWDGRGVLVSGGSRGIGRAVAIASARWGADVVLQYRVHAVPAKAVVDEIHRMGRRAWAVPGDAGRRTDAQQVVRRAEESLGAVHAVFACAGVDGSGPLESTTELSWRRTLDTDLYGPFALVQAAAPALRNTGGSAVIVGGAPEGRTPADSIDLSAANAGLRAVARGLAAALAPATRVNAVATSWVETDLTSTWHSDPESRAAVRKRIPLGRWGRPDDVAEAALFLASDEARFITGQTLVVDGGSSLVGPFEPDFPEPDQA